MPPRVPQYPGRRPARDPRPADSAVTVRLTIASSLPLADVVAHLGLAAPPESSDLWDGVRPLLPRERPDRSYWQQSVELYGVDATAKLESLVLSFPFERVDALRQRDPSATAALRILYTAASWLNALQLRGPALQRLARHDVIIDLTFWVSEG